MAIRHHCFHVREGGAVDDEVPGLVVPAPVDSRTFCPAAVNPHSTKSQVTERLLLALALDRQAPCRDAVDLTFDEGLGYI